MTIEFFDDLPVRNGRAMEGIQSEFAQALRDQPGRWAKYPEQDGRSPGSLSAAAYRISKGSHLAPKNFRSGFEAVVRRGVLYVRFVGGSA